MSSDFDLTYANHLIARYKEISRLLTAERRYARIVFLLAIAYKIISVRMWVFDDTVTISQYEVIETVAIMIVLMFMLLNYESSRRRYSTQLRSLGYAIESLTVHSSNATDASRITRGVMADSKADHLFTRWAFNVNRVEIWMYFLITMFMYSRYFFLNL